MSTDEITDRLSRFAAGLRADAIPVRVRLYAKTLLLDALACAFAGHEGEDTPKVQRFARALGTAPECSVIGDGPLALPAATVLNGFLITAVSMCDVYRPTATHLQPVVIPPALAIAERDDASGSELLVALVAGFEIAVRIAAGLNYPAFRARGWHGPGTIAPFGAAAAVGRLLRFDAPAMATAFALAGSQAAGTFAAWGTPTVKFHQCRGALSGLMAALLAEQGLAAARDFLSHADGGFYPTYSGEPPGAAATRSLGSHWELEQIALRPWPTSAASQGMLTALLDLVRQHDLEPQRVAGLRIHVSPATHAAYAGRRDVHGPWEASSSLHCTAALALHDRYVWLDQFAGARYDDPALRRFIQERIELVPDAALDGVQARVEMTLSDGSVLSGGCDAPKGSPENPLTAQDVVAKFHQAVGQRMDPAAARAVVEAVWGLDTLESVRVLCERLRAR